MPSVICVEARAGVPWGTFASKPFHRKVRIDAYHFEFSLSKQARLKSHRQQHCSAGQRRQLWGLVGRVVWSVLRIQRGKSKGVSVEQ